jgi:N-acetylglucosaminyldiphosphoundecaprenol N-acetyl-beta-D-mannosaminyltransferase
MLNDIQTLQKNSHTISEKISEKARILIRNARLNFEILKSFLNTYPRVTILGVALDNLSIFEAVDFVRNSIVERTPRQIITVNPELVYLATLDDSLKNLINSADLKTADGAGLLWAANYLKVPLKERVTGIDLMVRLLQLADQMRYRIFLLGSCEKIITQTTAAIQRQYPNLKLVGFQNGYFTDDAATVQKIKSSRPDILFVGMGAPKQDRWLAEHKNELGVPVCIGVGGSFDVVAGLKPRAPRWIQKMRAEWVYRLIKEPWRIKRQVNLFKFMWLVRKERKSQRSGI